MNINYSGVNMHIPLKEEIILKNGCGYLRTSDASEVYFLGLDPPQCLLSNNSLQSINEQFNIPKAEAPQTVWSTDFGMTLNLIHDREDWCFQLALGNIAKNLEYDISDFTPEEQSLINEYIALIQQCLKTGQAVKIGQVSE